MQVHCFSGSRCVGVPRLTRLFGAVGLPSLRHRFFFLTIGDDMSVVKRPRTYRSVIGTCADALRRWRAGTGYTRETMAVMLFEQHCALGVV